MGAKFHNVPQEAYDLLGFLPYGLEVEEHPRQREHQVEWKQHGIIV